MHLHGYSSAFPRTCTRPAVSQLCFETIPYPHLPHSRLSTYYLLVRSSPLLPKVRHDIVDVGFILSPPILRLLALDAREREGVCVCVGLNAPRGGVVYVLQIYIQLHTVRTQSVACTDSICQRRQLRRISYPSRLVHVLPLET